LFNSSRKFLSLWLDDLSQTPFSDDTVAFLFLAVILWLFTWIQQNKVEFSCFLVYYYIKMPFVVRTIPKLYGVILMFAEKYSQIFGYCNYLLLMQMYRRVEYLFYCVNCISYNYDIWGILYLNCLINTTSNSE